MRKLLAMVGVTLLLLVAVPFASAATSPAYRHVEGSFVATGNPPYSATFLFEVRASSTGRVEFGYYQTELMRAPTGELPYRSFGTVRTVRFFKAASGAPAAEFTGRECIVAAPDSTTVGNCPWYHIIVTDGASIGAPDTFCGARVATECHAWIPTYGDVRIS
jgi:hypothetical protein